jgi:PilZ domain-containing protein
MSQPMRERRKAPRVVAKLAMQVAGVESGESVVTTESVNLSSSGIQFQAKGPLAPLTRVALTLLVPPFGRRLRRERVVRCEGVIVRCIEVERPRRRPQFELACYFTQVTDQDRELVEQYVVWRSLRRVSTRGQSPVAPRARRQSAAP